MAAKGQYKIPFDASGNLMNYANGYFAKDATWVDNYRFQDELEYIGFSHGRSSVQMYFKSTSSGREYNMSLGDFSECIMKGLLQNKKITCEFTFAKRGANFMLTPLLPKAP